MKATVHERMKYIREAMELTQKQISSDLGLKQGSYSSMETTSKTISGPVLKLLELLYNVNIDYLLNGKGAPFKTKTDKSTILLTSKSGEAVTRHGIKAPLAVMELKNDHLNETIRRLEDEIAVLKAEKNTLYELLRKK